MYSVPTAFMKAALLCASTEKLRYYLKGVYVDPAGLIAATDGHRLFVGKLCESAKPAEGFIIPSEVIKSAIAFHKNAVVEFDEAQIAGRPYTPVDGFYPDWRRVVPYQCDGRTAQFNTAYVNDFGKIAKAWKSKAQFFHNGDGPAGVDLGHAECFGVLMPLRFKDTIWNPTRVIGN